LHSKEQFVTRTASPQKAGPKSSQPSTLPIGLRLQRKCACGGTHREDESCPECRRGALQKRTVIGASDDAFEREADRVAADVLRSPRPIANEPPRIQRLPLSHGEAVPAAVDTALQDEGRPLESRVRADMQHRFGYDFSNVRVHTDPIAQRSALGVGAQAYTVGRDVVFGPGQYAPGTQEGRRLIAHELTHVVQQGTGHGRREGATIQRKPDPKEKLKASGKKSAPTAASAPRLDLTPSKKGDACACLMVVHNDEQNARKTARLMHENCSYNLALVEPDTGSRLIKIPGRSARTDPNSMFHRDVAEKCLDSEQACREFVAANAKSTDPKVIEDVVETQFFLAVDDCSARFSLPVVVLHNNDIEDTKNYLKNKGKKGTSDLKLDVDKTDPKAGAEQVKKLKDLIRTKFGEGIEKELQTEHKTNIFRWCASEDLSRCHIGDPDHPDNITWVTNARDFDALRKKGVNVVLQSAAPVSKKSESEGDLSSLFPLLREILTARLPLIVAALEQQRQLDWDAIDALLDDFDKIFKFGDATPHNVLERLREIIRLLVDIMLKGAAIVDAPNATQSRIDRLRFVNIEAPGKRLIDQTDAERIRNYESVVEVLKTVGLHCCGHDPKKAEESVKGGLKST
jgi:hypothetical protein